MSRSTRMLMLLPLAALLVAGLPGQAAGAAGGDYFVVDTQFRDSPSDIVDAGGAFAGCTSVTDLGGIAEQIKPRKVIFIGDKLVHCDGGEVLIHYNATLNFESGKRTSGHWFVVDSTLDGVSEGYGTVRGDSTACTIAPDSGGCILDTFAGHVQ